MSAHPLRVPRRNLIPLEGPIDPGPARPGPLRGAGGRGIIRAWSRRSTPRMALAGAGDGPVGPPGITPASNSMADSPTIPLIETPSALRELVDHLRDAGRFAFDTEFVSEETFEPVL